MNDNADIVNENDSELGEGVIEGRNSVTEAMNVGITLDKVYIAKGDDKTLARIAAKAKASGAVVIESDRRALDSMSVTKAHQGVIAHTAITAYADIDDILELARAKNEDPFIVVCDSINDTQNLGAIIRTAECAGAHGIIIPKRRSAGLTAGVGKSSAGAVWHMPVARTPNLASTLTELKKAGLWIFGADPDVDGGNSIDLWSADLTGAVCLVIGSEGAGMGRLIRERCDFLVSIPMNGKMTSLNASASAAILLYEAVRQRKLPR